MKIYVRFMYIEKASQYFDLIRNRDLPNKRGWSWVYRSLNYVLCLSFLVGTEGFYLSIFCESEQIFNTVLWRLARLHRFLDNSFHRWHILLFVPLLSKKCIFWRIWSKTIGFVVIHVILCTMLTISLVPTMVICINVLNYAYRGEFNKMQCFHFCVKRVITCITRT